MPTYALPAPGHGELSADVEADLFPGVAVIVDGVAPLHGKGVQVKQMPLVGGVGETSVSCSGCCF